MKGKCNDCGKETNLEKHHVCYSPQMIIALCKSCHRKRHTTGNAPRKLPIGMTSMIVDFTLEQDIWLSTKKIRLGFRNKNLLLRKLVRDAMLAEQTFDEVKEAAAQEHFEN